MLEESAEEMGLDLTAIDVAESSNEERIKDKIVKNHVCCRAARKYAEMATAFFESEYHPDLLVVGEAEMRNAAELQKIDRPDGPATLEEMIEIIQEKIFPAARNFVRPGFDQQTPGRL